MSIIGTVYEDVTTDVLGSIGSWQWLVTFVSTTLTIPSFFNYYEDMFLIKPSDEILCIPTEPYEVVNSSLCSVIFVTNGTQEFVCKEWHVKLLWLIWIRKSWLTFCGEKLKPVSTAMICRLGLIFGYVIFGIAADTFGRRTAIIVDVFADVLLTIVITFCDSEGWFQLLVFLKSLFASANIYMTLVLICEISSNNWRSWLMFLGTVPRALAMVTVVPLANSLPNLDTYSFIAFFCGTLYLPTLRWIFESPQWLIFNRKIAVAEKILFKAATKNGIKLCSDFKIRPVNHRAYNCLDDTRTFIAILRTQNSRLIILTMLLLWALHNFMWSSIYVQSYGVENQNFLTLKVICVVVMIMCLTFLLSKKLAMRLLLVINILIMGTLASLVIIFGKNELVQAVLPCIALGTGVTSQVLILIITPRLFALNIRATAFGCCHATGQLGSIISCLIIVFHVMDDIFLASVQIGVMLILASLCLIIPDVDDRELPDIVDDMDYFSELSKPLRWASQKTNSPSHEEVEMRVYSFGSGANTRISNRHSEERLPARPIGFIRLWHLISGCIQCKALKIK